MSDPNDPTNPSKEKATEKVSQFFHNQNGQMVTYQFRCSECNHITEERCLFGEPPPNIQCQNPNCQGVAYKIISTPRILTGIPTHPARKGRGKGF